MPSPRLVRIVRFPPHLNTDHEHHTPQTHHSRFRPRRLLRRGVRRARQPLPRRHHRHAAGRPADDHHRSRQLAGRRRRRAGPRADGPLPAPRRALQDRNHLRPDPHRQADRKALHPDRRFRHLHLRCADHRHRRLGHVPRPAVRAGLHGQGRVGLRHLRRLLLQEPGCRRHRRRQHRGRGSAVSRQHRPPRHRWCTAATPSRPRRSSSTT